MRCYLFDLDGTLANIDHRLHFIRADVPKPGLTDSSKPYTAADVQLTEFRADWDSFYAACVGDAPILPLCHLVHSLLLKERVIFVSGRSEVVREQTLNWLYQYVAPPAYIKGRCLLFMRKDKDHRQDHIIKAEMLDEIVAGGHEVIMAFDDRQQVVDMWRSRGIVCAQVAPGDF